MLVHLLTPGFTTPNGRAFLFPLVVWRREIAEAGIRIKMFDDERAAGLGDADLLVVDSKYHKDRWASETGALLDRFAAWRDRVPVAFFDTSDSSGWVLAELLPVVTAYCKNQLLRDRTLYARPLYGRRLHTDYYHRKAGIEDERPETGVPIGDPALPAKLHVYWNSGLADYSRHGPSRMALYQHLRLPALLRFPEPLARPGVQRPNPVACRFGTGYARRTVAWQRLEIRRVLAARLSTDKLGRGAYMHELATSKVVVSPFGLGEITLKDFEVFLTGGLLLKPDMSHLETWPDFFRGGETMVAHSWDLDDLPQVLDECIAAFDEKRPIAMAGQERYRQHTSDAGAAALFVAHLQALLGAVTGR